MKNILEKIYNGLALKSALKSERSIFAAEL